MVVVSSPGLELGSPQRPAEAAVVAGPGSAFGAAAAIASVLAGFVVGKDWADVSQLGGRVNVRGDRVSAGAFQESCADATGNARRRSAQASLETSGPRGRCPTGVAGIQAGIPLAVWEVINR